MVSEMLNAVYQDGPMWKMPNTVPSILFLTLEASSRDRDTQRQAPGLADNCVGGSWRDVTTVFMRQQVEM